MIHDTLLLTASDGQTIHYQSWYPDGAVRAVMLVVHGAAEHGGRYAEFASRLSGRGFAVIAIDLPGHGKSDGSRCCVRSFDEYLDAVELAHAHAEREVLERVRSVESDAETRTRPFFLVGHSMGGLIASLYLQRHQDRFAGAIFSGAALVADPEPPAIQVMILRVLAKWLPALGVLKLDADGVSRDPDVVARYVSDPEVFTGKLPASMLVSMFLAMSDSRDGVAGITLPVLIMHGEADRLVSPRASMLLSEQAGSRDKTLKLYPGLFHEIFNEPERVGIIDEVMDWAERRLPVSR